mgnify:CR=1 FL=1
MKPVPTKSDLFTLNRDRLRKLPREEAAALEGVRR